MHHFECDILVIGGGPAGSSAAKRAAQNSLKVVLVERKPVVGVPVRCAEYVPASLIGEVRPASGFSVQKVHGMKTILPDGNTKEVSAPGWIIRRDRFDQALLEEARKAGVKIMLSTSALEKKSDGVVIKNGDAGLRRVTAKVIIGADGPHSKTGRWIGSENRNLIPGIQVSVPLQEPMTVTEVYFDNAFFGGYGWVFPKGDNANVGIGMRVRDGKMGSLKHALSGFLSLLERRNKIHGKTVHLTTGWIPAELPRKIVKDNIILVGDAAGQTHPISGAGIAQAVICGQMAGKWASRAAESDNLELLEEYEMEWRELFEESQVRAFKKRILMEREWNRLAEIIPQCWIAFREYYNVTRLQREIRASEKTFLGKTRQKPGCISSRHVFI